MKRPLLISLFILIVSAASLTYILLPQLIDQPVEAPPLPPEIDENIPRPRLNQDVKFEAINSSNTNQPRLRFYRDNLTLVERDFADSPIVIKLELNRREDSPNKFTHYYSVSYMNEGTAKTDYYSFKSDQSDVKAADFLPHVENLIAADLSSREEYQFELELPETSIKAVVTDLDGDFITKIQPGYTRYTSVGEAEVAINNQELTFDASLEKIYSEDSSVWIFFDGVYDLESTTDKLVMWNEDGDYYLLDTTTTNKYQHEYRPHTWVLHKDSDQRANLKSFTANLDREKLTDDLWRWQVGFPEFEVEIDVEGLHLSGVEREYGVLNGVLKNTKDQSEQKIHGFFVFKPR